MHQYTADLANRMAASGHDVSLITTSLLPRDRYAPNVHIDTPVSTSNSGLSLESININQYKSVAQTIADQQPNVVHFTGPHIWNPGLLKRVQQKGIPVVHTIHDLDPHKGTKMGLMLYLWNRSIIRMANITLVHGQGYSSRLLEDGYPRSRIVHIPLLHMFLSYEIQATLDGRCKDELDVSYEPFALFFGRLEPYKGIEFLLTAFAQIMDECPDDFRIILAGPGDLNKSWTGNLPERVELYNRFIPDNEAFDLFRRCSLVLLPYIDATQSALIASAYYLRKPVLVSRSGALPEYVIDGQTGYIVEPGHPATLARALKMATSSPDRLRQMGYAGRQWYERQRSAEEKTLQKMYHSLL